MKHLIAILAAAGAGASVLPANASADDALEQIIVTGARTPIAAADIGSAVTVITRDDIDSRQARYVTDLLRAVPGFSVSHSGVVGSQTQVRVRGSEANHVLVLIDGVRANDPATGDEFRWEYLATANIERIEIVRGPQSALWGSDAVGGVVHIITRAGGERPGFDGYLEGGSENTRNGAFSARFGNDAWTVAIGAEQLTTDGFNISRSGDETDDAEITTATVNARFSPREAIALDIGLRSVEAYSQFDGVDWYVTGLPTDSDVATDTAQLYAHVGASFGTAEQRVRHHVKLRYFDSDNRNVLEGRADISTASDRRSVAYQADLDVGNNRVAIAVEHETTGFEQRGAVIFDDPNQDQSMDVTSVVADFQGRGTDAMTWLLSARYDDSSDFDDVVTGRASLAWHVSETTTLRANVGSGQKTPTFVERFGYYAQSFEGNPELKPERSTSYDVGIDQHLGAVAVQLSLFRQDLRDEINGFHCPNPWPAPCTAVNMGGTSRRSGVELGANWSALESLEFGLSYTYTDSADADSAAELRRPRHAGSVHANYRFMEQRGQFSLAADYGGTRQDVFYPPWPNPSEIVTLDDYWLVDVVLQYRVSDELTMFARGSNLLDTKYEQVFGYRTPGRSWYGGIRVQFGR
jgi:vitamin B12 transporter